MNTYILFSKTALDQEQPDTSSTVSISDSDQEQAKVDKAAREIVLGQEEPVIANPTLCSHVGEEHQESIIT